MYLSFSACSFVDNCYGIETKQNKTKQKKQKQNKTKTTTTTQKRNSYLYGLQIYCVC